MLMGFAYRSTICSLIVLNERWKRIAFKNFVYENNVNQNQIQNRHKYFH